MLYENREKEAWGGNALFLSLAIVQCFRWGRTMEKNSRKDQKGWKWDLFASSRCFSTRLLHLRRRFCDARLAHKAERWKNCCDFFDVICNPLTNIIIIIIYDWMSLKLEGRKKQNIEQRSLNIEWWKKDNTIISVLSIYSLSLSFPFQIKENVKST